MQMPQMRARALRGSMRLGIIPEVVHEEDYAGFKRELDRGKHPTFIGKKMFERYAMNGGAIRFVSEDGACVAVVLINPRNSCLQALNVSPRFRGSGIGSEIMDYLIPNWVRAIDSKKEWFQRLGYKQVGQPKQGRQLKTWIMVREKLITLAGNISIALSTTSNENESSQTQKPG